MSDKEEKDTNKFLDNRLSVGNKIPVVITEGNALSLISSTSSQRNVPWPAVPEGSGDLGRILQEHLKKPDPETELTGMSMEVINTDVGKSSGDHAAKSKVSETSKSDVTTRKVESSFPFLHKRNEFDLKKADDLDEIEDEDMQLRWDDDDADAKNDDILSEEQLLEESSDVITKNLSDDDKRLEDELLKEPDLNTEAINSPEMDFDVLQESDNLNTESINSPEMDFEKLSFLQETDLNAEAISSPEMDILIEESENQDDANVLEPDLLEESEIQEENQAKEFLKEKKVGKQKESKISGKIKVIAEAKEILGEKSMVEYIEESDISSEIQVIAEEILGEKCIVEEVAETETKSAKLAQIAQAKEILGEKSVIDKQEKSELKQVIELAKEILGEKSMVEESEQHETDSAMQVRDEPNKTLEEKIMVKEVRESERNSAKQVIALAKELFGEKSLVEEPEQHETDNAMQVRDKPEETLEEKSMVKEAGESEMNSAKQLIVEAAEILVDKSIVEAIKETELVEFNFLKDVTTDTHAKEVPKDIINEAQEESDSTSHTEVANFKVPSFTDVILSKINDDVTLENKETDCKGESSVTILAKGIESSIITPEKEVQINKEDDDVLLDNYLLEKASEVPESDVEMEVDDEKEGELLKDVEDDSCTPMDVDITGDLIEDQAKMEEKIIDQPMDDHPEMSIKEIAHSIDDQTNVEKDDVDVSTEEVKNMDQSDDQVKTSEKIIDQPNVDTTETIKVTNEITFEDKIAGKAESEKENTDRIMDDEIKIDDHKEQIVEETNTTEESTNSPAETTPITVSSTYNVLTQDLEKSSPKNTILETESKDKIETVKPEEITDNVIKDTDLNKTEEIKETKDPVDKNIDTDDVSPNNSTIFRADSPVPIKTDHGLHKPDVMLEIPTQELIDMDDTDFSMDLDQSMVSLNDVYKNFDEETELEKIVDETVPDDESGDEKALDQAIADNNTVKDTPVDQKVVVTETTITTDDNTVNEKTVVTETAIADDNDTANEISADQKAVVSETVSAADDDTVADKSVDQKAVVSETATTANDDTVKDTLVDQNAEVTETAIATDDVTVNEKSVEQIAVVTDTIVTDNEAVNDKSVDQITEVTETIHSDHDTINDKSVDLEAMVTETQIVSADDTAKEMLLDQKAEVTETAIATDDVTVNDKSVDQEAKVTETAIVTGMVTKTAISVEDDTANKISVDQKSMVPEKTITTNDVTVEETAVDQEAIVIVSTVSEVQVMVNDGDVMAENDRKVEDTVVEETIEENLEKMFADDANEVLESTASTSQAQLLTEQPPAPITQMTPDTADEVPEISDSLGLLAESSGRMIEDDEEPEDDDDGDDDDDFDNDESSNQISAEQSEDSNPVQEGKDLETPDNKDTEDAEYPADIMDEGGKYVMRPIEPMETIEPAEPMDIDTVQLSDNEGDVERTEEQQAVAEPSKDGEDQQQQKQSPSKSPNKTDTTSKQSPSQLALSPSKSNQSPSKTDPSVAKTKSQPSKTQEDKSLKIKVSSSGNQEGRAVVNIVNLDESSSSEDDLQEVEKQPEPDKTSNDKPSSPDREVTNVNIPTGIEIMCSGSAGSTSEITTKEGEVVISGVPKPPPHKPARLNTSEVSIKTVSAAEPMVIPETTMNDQAQSSTQSQPKLGLEIFSLDSDDEDAAKDADPEKTTVEEQEKARETSKCINYLCESDGKGPFKVADAAVVAYYVAGKKSRSLVCQPCADAVSDRTKNLIQGIKDLTPLLQLEMKKLSQDLVEISDSESEDEDMTTDEPKETIGEKGAKFVEDNLTKFLNETWKKYDMDVRLKETQLMLDDEIEKLEQDSKEIDAMLNDCQEATDKLRNELYATFECRKQPLPALVIYDTTDAQYIGVEEPTPPAEAESEPIETRLNKRRLSSTSDQMPAKRPAIPLGYAPLDNKENAVTISAGDAKIDDDKDISVVKLSAEAAPAELPPPGEISRPPLRVGVPVYAMKNAFGPWLKGRVLEIVPKNPSSGIQFSMCKVKFDHKVKTNGKVLPARCIAYSEPADVRMTIGTRLIAIFKNSNKRESFYSGVVAEIPNPVNNYRYLVFFDDGYAQYVQHQYTRLVCESSNLVWEEVHPFSRDFVKEYLLAYPERPMVRLHEGQHLKTEWNGKWWSSRVIRVDASLAQVMFVGDGRREWIYRGSTRLAPLYLELRAAERHRPRPMPRSKAQPRFNMPYVEYTRSDEPESIKLESGQTPRQQQMQINNEEIRRQRAVAKKSTSAPAQVIPPSQQIVHPTPTEHQPVGPHQVTSRVVYYTPKHAVRPLRMFPHRCSPKCKRSDVLSLKELRTYNPLAKPLLSGWERQIVRFKGNKEVMYRAPCGRRLRNMRELHQYLRMTESDFPVDLFDFSHGTHCLAEFVLNKCLVGKKDLSHGKENVPVPCVNYYDDSLPEFCSYNTERTPTAGVPLNLEPEFLCGCDCTDDCQDKSKCACWKMTLEGARTIGLTGPNVGYVYKRLPEPLPSGIYECNSRCKCKNTCLNRVAQHPLQLKLQVFKTPNRGWGIRALNDVPKGSFLCVYAGNLLTDATANLDGLNEGDEYLAELDYIEVVEQMKEGYEEDIPEADKKLDKKEGKNDEESDEDEPSSSEEDDTASKTDKEDDDFRPGYIGLGVTEFSKRLRRREKSKKDKLNSKTDDKEKEKDTTKENAEEDCITISDDEEVREPSRFMAQTNMGANEYISKYKSVRTLFGKDEACYIMDAKVQGNIGRYLNHSCSPNVFVQNVFVDTHDPRFPWVAFFALCYIRAGTELTWNYNYDVGSVPGKVLYCHCGADNCRGRLL